MAKRKRTTKRKATTKRASFNRRHPRNKDGTFKKKPSTRRRRR